MRRRQSTINYKCYAVFSSVQWCYMTDANDVDCITSLRIHKTTLDVLKDIGKKGDTYESIILRLIPKRKRAKLTEASA